MFSRSTTCLRLKLVDRGGLLLAFLQHEATIEHRRASAVSTYPCNLRVILDSFRCANSRYLLPSARVPACRLGVPLQLRPDPRGRIVSLQPLEWIPLNLDVRWTQRTNTNVCRLRSGNAEMFIDSKLLLALARYGYHEPIGYLAAVKAGNAGAYPIDQGSDLDRVTKLCPNVASTGQFQSKRSKSARGERALRE